MRVSVILYTTHCPKCNVLSKKLNEKNITYTEVNDVNIMSEKNIVFTPYLEVDDELMDFTKAVAWVNAQ